MKSLSMKNRTIIAIVLFVAIFAALIAVASVYDFQISQILTKNALKPGDYIANDIFGVVGEAVGTSPIYIVLSVCTAILCWFFARNFGKKWWGIVLSVAFAIAGAVAWWFYIKDAFRYVLEHAAAQVGSSAGAIVYEFRHDGAVVAIQWLIALTIQALNVLAFKNLKPETLKKLFWWVVAVIAAVVVANILIMIIKDPVGRMRYRAINSNVGDLLINSGVVQGYTPWYVSNGQPSEDVIKMFVDAYPGASDAFKSFPSGHTCAAGMSYALIMLPDVIDFKSEKSKKGVKIACWIIPIAITMLVAISRIVVGAHYMSDVTFGGTLAFVCMIIAREIFVCKGSHFFALFPSAAPKKLAKVEVGVEGTEGFDATDIDVDAAEQETQEDEFVDELVEKFVQDTQNLDSEEVSDEKREEAAISEEQADKVSQEIADNLRDGVISE